MRTLPNQFTGCLLLSLTLLYVLAVSVPVTFLLENHMDIGLTLSDIWYLFSNYIILIPAAVLVTLLFFRTDKYNNILYSLILTVLIISIFIPNQTGYLDGIRDDSVFLYSSNDLWYFGKFLLLFSTLLILYKRQQANLKALIFLLFIASLGQISYLIYELQQKEKVFHNKVTGSLATLSSNRNILIISLDGLQGDVVEDAFNDNPVLIEQLTGFKYYPNVSSSAPNTQRSNFITMLGKVPPLETLTKDWFSKYTTALLPQVLSDQYGYEATTYNTAVPCNPENNKWVCYGHNAFFKQYGEYDDRIENKSIYLYAIMRIFPAFFAEKIYNTIFEFTNNTKEKTPFILASEDTGKHKFGRSYFELLTFIENLKTVNKPPVFIFHHYVFTHQPSNFDKECNYTTSSKVAQNINSARAETKCALKMMSLITKKLKQIGAYDNSLIFFMSDHGLEANMNITPIKKDGYIYRGNTVNYNGNLSISRYNPMLFYKDFSATGDMKVIYDNVSLVDIFPTICKKLNALDYCQTLGFEGVELDYSSAKRINKALMYTGGVKNIGTYFDKLNNFKIISFSGDSRRELQKIFESTYPKSYTYNPTNLHHNIGIIQSTSIKSDPNSSKSGFLSFGPYVKLPKGNYRISIDYSSLSTSHDKVGWWDIVANKGKTKFLRNDIFGSDGKDAVLKATFFSDGTLNDFEYRIFYNGKGDLKLHGIKVDKID